MTDTDERYSIHLGLQIQADLSVISRRLAVLSSPFVNFEHEVSSKTTGAIGFGHGETTDLIGDR